MKTKDQITTITVCTDPAWRDGYEEGAREWRERAKFAELCAMLSMLCFVACALFCVLSR